MGAKECGERDKEIKKRSDTRWNKGRIPSGKTPFTQTSARKTARKSLEEFSVPRNQQKHDLWEPNSISSGQLKLSELSIWFWL